MAEKAMGTKLKINTHAIGSLTSISGVKPEKDTIDVTTMDDAATGYRQHIAGLKDGGEVEVEGFAKFSDTDGQMALIAAYENDTVDSYEIVYPSGTKWTFQGIVTGYEFEANMEDAIPFNATIKVTGKPTLTVASGT